MVAVRQLTAVLCASPWLIQNRPAGLSLSSARVKNPASSAYLPGSSHYHQRAELTTASGQLNGYLGAVSRGRCHTRSQTETDVVFGGAVTTAMGSCACSRRTPY